MSLIIAAASALSFSPATPRRGPSDAAISRVRASEADAMKISPLRPTPFEAVDGTWFKLEQMPDDPMISCYQLPGKDGWFCAYDAELKYDPESSY